VISGPPVVPSGCPGDPRHFAGDYGRNIISKFVSHTKEIKNTHIYVCVKLPLLVDLQQKLGPLVFPVTSCPTIIILNHTLNEFVEKCGFGNFDHSYSLACISRCGEFYKSGSRLPKI
jgi:hypothetical protein